MQDKICLVIIYNHKYEKNIPVLNRIYGGRFSYVYHVMPFYTGNDPSVISVYENSYQFSGYIAQAAAVLPKDATHYLFVADDMVLNPGISEKNVLDWLHCRDNESFINNLRLVDDSRFVNWIHAVPSVMNLLSCSNACEWRSALPDIEEARRRFECHGINWKEGISDRLYKVVRCGCMARKQTAFDYRLIPPFSLLRKYHELFRSSEKVYPLIEGYSDFLLIPGSTFAEFAHYCGVFAATRVFVEIAIPTALVLSSEKIQTMDRIGMAAETGIVDYSIRQKIEEKYNCLYGKMIEDFPQKYVFIHPVKLSKWKDLP